MQATRTVMVRPRRLTAARVTSPDAPSGADAVRTTELDDANAFLEAILSTLRAGVVVIDAGMRVRAWNRRAEDL